MVAIILVLLTALIIAIRKIDQLSDVNSALDMQIQLDQEQITRLENNEKEN